MSPFLISKVIKTLATVGWAVKEIKKIARGLGINMLETISDGQIKWLINLKCW